MKTKAALGEFIRNQRHGAQMSLRAMSKVAGVSLPYLSQIERGLRRPSAEILQAIAKALRISSHTLYVQAGILEEHPRADVLAAVMADPGLTERQKQALLAVYNSFREETERRRARRKQADPASTSATVIPIEVRTGSARSQTRSRSRASGRAETQADPKPSPGSPSSSRSPTSRATTKGGAR
jgi:transcriptional regulator with XRE-family HTH domain